MNSVSDFVEVVGEYQSVRVNSYSKLKTWGGGRTIVWTYIFLKDQLFVALV